MELEKLSFVSPLSTEYPSSSKSMNSFRRFVLLFIYRIPKETIVNCRDFIAEAKRRNYPCFYCVLRHLHCLSPCHTPWDASWKHWHFNRPWCIFVPGKFRMTQSQPHILIKSYLLRLFYSTDLFFFVLKCKDFCDTSKALVLILCNLVVFLLYTKV